MCTMTTKLMNIMHHHDDHRRSGMFIDANMTILTLDSTMFGIASGTASFSCRYWVNGLLLVTADYECRCLML